MRWFLRASSKDDKYEAESEKIRENSKGPGSKPHKFKPAKWTSKNGHPRCILCGDEEAIDGQCPGRE